MLKHSACTIVFVLVSSVSAFILAATIALLWTQFVGSSEWKFGQPPPSRTSMRAALWSLSTLENYSLHSVGFGETAQGLGISGRHLGMTSTLNNEHAQFTIHNAHANAPCD